MTKDMDMATPPDSFLQKALRISERSLVWLLPLLGSSLVFYLAWPFLNGEINRAWDDLFHQSTQALVADALADGRNPFGLLPTHFGIPGLRIYQCFHPLVAGTLEWLTGFDTSTVHGWLVAIFFAATPWTYRHFLVRIGLPPLAASIAALLYVGSITGFGNSFEAYYELGIVTQALGSVLMPLGMAKIVQICQEDRGYVGAGVFLALTMMTHAMFAVYAVLVSFFIVVFFARRLRTLLILVLAGGLALVLCLGWTAPFLALRQEHKSVSDMVSRPDRIIWSAGHSGGSLGRALVSGRVLDGGRKDGTADEKLDNKLNMTFTREVRFPYYSLLAALGVILALAGHRNRENRLLVSGLAAGLLLILGFDDFPILCRLPLFNQIQAFRVGYFIEFFGIALAAFAAWRVTNLMREGVGRLVSEPASRALMLLVIAVATTGYLFDTVRIQTPLLDSWDPTDFDRVRQKLARAGAPDPDLRVLVKFQPPPSRQHRYALEHALEVRHGYRSLCNHWTSLSPSVNLPICIRLSFPEDNQSLVRLAGVRYLIVNDRQIDKLLPKSGRTSSARYKQLGRKGRNLYILEDLAPSMLHSPAGPRVLVFANADQWYWLTRRWVERYSSEIESPSVPWLARGDGGILEDDELVGMFDGIMYLDEDDLDGHTEALKRAADKGKTILLGKPVDGIDGVVMKPGSQAWPVLLDLGEAPASSLFHRRIDNRLDPSVLEFSTRSDRSVFAMLSMQAYENWTATIDGEPTPVMASGPDLATVILPAGEHRLRFEFAPTSLESATGWISVVSWLALILFQSVVWGLRLFIRRRARPGTDQAHKPSA